MTSADHNFNLNTRGKRPAFFESSETDALMTALLETMSQLWATRAQVNLLQKALIGKGLLTAEELENVILASCITRTLLPTNVVCCSGFPFSQ